MTPPTSNRQKTFAHLVILKIQWGHIGVYQGPIPKEVQDDIAKFMEKHNLVRIEAMVVPCKEHIVRFEVDEQEEKSKSDIGPGGPNP